MNRNRRCFLGLLFACAGAAALAEGRLGTPNLRVGIVSDIHISPTVFGCCERHAKV